MGKRTIGLISALIECSMLVVLCISVQYSSDYTIRLLVLYLISQCLFGHYLFATILIWDEIRLLLLSHLSFYLISLLLLPMIHFSMYHIFRNFVIAIILFIFTVFLTRTLRLSLNKYCGERVLIIGTGKEAKGLASVCKGNRFSMMNVKAVINPKLKNSRNEISELEYLSNSIYPIESLVDVLKKERITEVILAAPELEQSVLDNLVHIANQYVRKIKYIPRIKDLVTFDSRIDDFDGLIVISKSNENKSKFTYFCKRAIDICGGIAGCLLVIPLTLYVRHVNHKNGDYDPVYFKQERIGKDGKLFVMYKFRTMIPNAEKVLDDLMQHDPVIKEEYSKNKKIVNDPRITKAGKVLRKKSLDEFPQFINVLKGEMSIVGPRPYLPREKEDMGTYYESVVSSKPGITGMWQSHGRNDVGFEDRCIMDDYYYRNWSLWLDITILIKTIKSLFSGHGAL